MPEIAELTIVIRGDASSGLEAIAKTQAAMRAGQQTARDYIREMEALRRETTLGINPTRELAATYDVLYGKYEMLSQANKEEIVDLAKQRDEMVAAGRAAADLARQTELYERTVLSLNREQALGAKATNEQKMAWETSVGSLKLLDAAQKENILTTARQMDMTVAASKREIEAIKATQAVHLKAAKDLAAAPGLLKSAGSTIKQTGSALTMGVSLPIAAIGAGSLMASMNFEAEFAKVRQRFTGETDETLAVIEKEIRRLTLPQDMGGGGIPHTAIELAHIAEIAGQMGIKAQDVTKFVDSIARVGDTTTLGIDGAAESMAQFANIMQVPTAEFSRLGSSIVTLGNMGAASETKMMEMATRMAGAGKVVGMSASDVLALSNAFASVGIEAEMGGSAASRVLIDISKDIADTSDKGQAKVKLLADVSGQSVQQFVKHFKDDAGGALIQFIKGLDDTQKAGGNVFGILDKLGMGNIRITQTLLNAKNAQGLFTQGIDKSSAAWKANQALVDQSNKRWDTTQSKFKELGNSIVDVAIDLGKELGQALTDMMPDIKELIKDIRDGVHWFTSLPEPERRAAEKMVLFGAALGPVVSALGSIVSFSGGVLGFFAKLSLQLGSPVVDGSIGGLLAKAGKWILTGEGAAGSSASEFSGLAAGAGGAGSVAAMGTAGGLGAMFGLNALSGPEAQEKIFGRGDLSHNIPGLVRMGDGRYVQFLGTAGSGAGSTRVDLRDYSSNILAPLPNPAGPDYNALYSAAGVDVDGKYGGGGAIPQSPFNGPIGSRIVRVGGHHGSLAPARNGGSSMPPIPALPPININPNQGDASAMMGDYAAFNGGFAKGPQQDAMEDDYKDFLNRVAEATQVWADKQKDTVAGVASLFGGAMGGAKDAKFEPKGPGIWEGLGANVKSVVDSPGYQTIQESKLHLDELTMSWQDYRAELLKLKGISDGDIKTIIGMDELAQAKQQLLQWKDDVTGILQSAFTEGFAKGPKAFFASFAQGLLQMIQQISATQLSNRVSSMLFPGTPAVQSAGGFGGGGSFFGGLLKGLFAHHAAPAPILSQSWMMKNLSFAGFATGGTPEPWTPFKVHKNEMVLPPMPPGTRVYNERETMGMGGSGAHTHYHDNSVHIHPGNPSDLTGSVIRNERAFHIRSQQKADHLTKRTGKQTK